MQLLTKLFRRNLEFGVQSIPTSNQIISWLKVNRLAAIALGDIGDERGVTALTEALNEESSDLRADAAMALSKLRATSR